MTAAIHPAKVLVTPTEISEVLIVEPRVFGDERGWFTESFNAQNFSAATNLDLEFVQDNHSFSLESTLRGMHYQEFPHQETKLVRCTRGKVYEVLLDLRSKSPTYKFDSIVPS